jgi:hypothetical protein
VTTYDVRSLDLGTSEIRGPQLYWMDAWDEWFTLQFQAVLLRAPGVTALVNTAPTDDLDSVHAEFPGLEWAVPPGARGRIARGPDQDIVAALATQGVRPQDVTHVILTPLELYTTGRLGDFPAAQICIAKRGWLHFHSTHAHPHDSRWRSIPRDTLTALVTRDWPRVRLLEDEDQVAPGLRTWWSGGHHRASIVVEVDTADGVVAISDTFFTYENVEDRRMLGLNECMEEVMTANERVLRVADHIVPIHDPKVFERYPDGIVSARALGATSQ